LLSRSERAKISSVGWSADIDGCWAIGTRRQLSESETRRRRGYFAFLKRGHRRRKEV